MWIPAAVRRAMHFGVRARPFWSVAGGTQCHIGVLGTSCACSLHSLQVVARALARGQPAQAFIIVHQPRLQYIAEPARFIYGHVPIENSAFTSFSKPTISLQESKHASCC